MDIPKFTKYNLIQSFRYAFSGFLFAMFREKNIQIQFATGAIFIGLTIIIGNYELLLAHVVLMTVVMGFELVNTAIEALADIVQPDFDERIGRVKDIMAAAVLLVSLVWFGLLLLILYQLVKTMI